MQPILFDLEGYQTGNSGDSTKHDELLRLSAPRQKRQEVVYQRTHFSGTKGQR
jgi:hypothetical protein